MERIREDVRHDAVAGSGPPSRRRQRIASVRDSTDGSTELPETVRLRDRAMRRERDRDSFDRNKRRRVERFVRVNKRAGDEESTEESVGGEEDDETEKRGSNSNHSQRKSSLSARVSQHTEPAESTAVDEIVGVTVPRKARSYSVKRSHEYLVSGNVLTSRRSSDSISPENLNISDGKTMKGTLNVYKSSTESQENIEIEIAEVLYGLMKQSQTSKKESLPPNSSPKLESNNPNDVVESEQPPANRETEISLQNPTSERCDASVQVASVSMEIQKELAEEENSRRMSTESYREDWNESAETIVMAKEESLSGPKLNNDLQDWTMTKGTSMGDEKQLEKINYNTKTTETLVSQKVEETKMKPTQEKRKWLTFDLENEDRDQTQDYENVGSRLLLGQDKKQQRQAEPTIPKREKNVLSSSSGLTNNLPRWASSLPPMGSKPTVMSTDVNTKTSKALQAPHLPTSQPRTKRCTTHHYIARNIYQHQQFVEISKFNPPPAGSASIYDTTPCNLSLMLPQNVNPKSTHGETCAPARSEKDKSLWTATKSSDGIQRKQLVFQQAPASVGNLQPHGATAAIQTGVLKSITSTNKLSLPASNSAPTSIPLPAGAATMSFSYPIIPANEAASLATLPNNGYSIPIPISSPFGSAPAFIGAAPAQAMPYFNGTFYSPQMFPPSQLHPQQPHSQPTVPPAPSGSSSSSSSHKKLQTQQPWGSGSGSGSQNKPNNFPTSKQLNPQSSKGGVEPFPQAFTVSFASPTSNSPAPNISFSSMAAQNPALFHNHPQAPKQGHQAIAAGQMAQQRHYQAHEANTGKESKAAGSGKPSPAHLFDNSARTLNFMSPPGIRNRPSLSVTSSAAVPTNSPSSQQQQPVSMFATVPTSPKSQQQLRHLQKQYAMQQQPSSNHTPASAKFHNNITIYSQAPNQINPFGGQSQTHPLQWKTTSAAPNMAPSGQNQNSASNVTSPPHQNQISFAGATSSVSTSPPPDRTGNSRMGPSQKSSPVCGRNVPSILMSPPRNQLSELKH